MVAELSDAFLYAQSACELWKEIAEGYGQSNGPLIYQLERELSQINQGNLTIASFFNKLKRCWDELQNFNGLPTCNCDKMRECTCSVIEKFIERDSNSKLIQFLIKLSDGYESVRSQILAMYPLPSVNKAYYIVQQIEKKKQVTNHAFEPTAFFASMNNKGGNSSKRNGKNVRNDYRHDVKRTCTHYNQEAHVSSGFDEHFHGDIAFDMGTKNKVAYGQNNGVDQKLVADVCQEMMKMFQGKSDMEDRTYTSTSQAGIMSLFTASFALFFHPNMDIKMDWINDTGASDHMTPNKSLFISTKALKKPIIVHLPYSTSKIVTIVGKVQLTPNLILTDMFYVPEFQLNLLLVGKLIQTNNLTAHFYPNDFMFQDATTKEIVAVGKGSRCLYICKPTTDKAAFSESPYKKPALNGAHYFFTIMDDYTRATWTYLVHAKSQIPALISSFLAYIETHFQAKPKFIRSDNGTEIVNSECSALCQLKGILHQKSMAYTPQQNGVVERKHRHLLDTARSIRLYDTVSWRFIKDILRNFGFPGKMVNWIMACIATPKFTICVNSERYGYFIGGRGLRQGDPISPYIFTMVMETLNLIVKDEIMKNKDFKYHFGCKQMKITHLCFADDLIMLSHGDKFSVTILKKALDKFSAISGLYPNLGKCIMLCRSLNDDTKRDISSIFPFKEGKLHMRYLGVPLVTKKIGVLDCKQLVDKVNQKLNDWKNKSLSYAGRAQLIASVLGSMQVYWGSVFLLPKTVVKDIEKCFKKFLWNSGESCKGKARVAWVDVCKPKDQGGLGFKSLELWNKTLLVKHLWNIASRKESLWVKWINVVKLKNISVWDVMVDNKDS
ncbi:RNA-directed DNA polymerase, eukaryota, reverse transcriptase zinc-binding domain protein [Tanacetum coccineum]